MATHNPAAAAVLTRLRAKFSRSRDDYWLPVGDALLELENLEERSDAGRPWSEVLLEVLRDLPVSTVSGGHLSKIRRVTRFVRETLSPDGKHYTDEEIAKAQFSALEVAARLHSVSTEAGAQALSDCIQNGKSFADMRREYEAFLQSHPDRLTGKQATWLKKRQVKDKGPRPGQIFEGIFLDKPERFLGMPGKSGFVLEQFDPKRQLPILGGTDIGYRVKVRGQEDIYLGVMVSTAAKWTDADLQRLLADLSFQSTFFDRYWLVATAPRTEISFLISDLKLYAVSEIGVVHFDKGSEQSEILLEPSNKGGVLYRRKLMADEVEANAMSAYAAKWRR